MNKIEFKPYDHVLVRDTDNQQWRAALYDQCLSYNENYLHRVIGEGLYDQCIPYKGNEYLLGTSDSPQRGCTQEESKKQDEVSNNYGYSVEYFKRNDIVLCRDDKDSYWRIDVFLHKNDSAPYPFRCNNSVWLECIPYEGNEQLLGTTDSPVTEPWKPKNSEMYYCIAWSVSSGFFTVRSHWNSHEPFDTDAWEAGNCFRTEEDAKQVIDRMNEALEGILSRVPGRLFDREQP